MPTDTISIAAAGDDYYFDLGAFPPVEVGGTATVDASAGLNNHNAHLRFVSTLAPSQTVDSASISLTAHGSSATPITLRVTGYDLFTGTFNPWPSPTPIGSPVDISVPSWNSGDRVSLTGASLTALIQTMLAQANYAAGRYLVLVLERAGGTATGFTFKAYESGASLAAQLVLTYSTGAAAAPGGLTAGSLLTSRNRRNNR